MLASLFKFLPETPVMPVIFAGHGNPMNAIEKNEFTETWKVIGQKIPRPTLIISISAHWESRGSKITALPQPPTIHDFGGFPKALYEVQYPAKGSPEFSSDMQLYLGTERITESTDWGLDHGTWSVLKHMFPLADIPVLQISLNRNLSPSEHYDFAQELAFLRKKGVLIFGSGNIIHNLREVDWNNAESGYDWAKEAREKINRLILSGDHKNLIEFHNLGTAVNKATPTDEHFLPLLYTLALQNKDEQVSLFTDKLVMGSLSMTGVMVGDITPD